MERGAGTASARETPIPPNGGGLENGESDAVAVRRRAKEEPGGLHSQEQTDKGQERPTVVPDSEGQAKDAAADRPGRLRNRVLIKERKEYNYILNIML